MMSTVGPPLRWIYRPLALEPAHLSSVQRTLVGLAFVLTLATIVLSAFDLRVHRGVDLRASIVGARVMLAGYDPYTFDWRAGMPDEWLDPVRGSEHPIRRLTKTPPTLWLFAPLARLSYDSVRLLSFAAEWAALLGSIVLLTRSLPRPDQRVIFLIGAVVFVASNNVWRRHLCAGQTYVFQLFALSAAISLWSRFGLDSVVVGVALAVVALLRPNLLLLAPAFLLLGCWRTGCTMAAAFLLGVAATIPFMHPHTWPSYLAMGDRFWKSEVFADLPPLDHKGPVEGQTFTLPTWERASTTLTEFYERLAGRIALPDLNLPALSKVLLAATSGLLLALVFLRRKGFSPRAAAALMVCLALDTEYFLPKRWEYADVMLLAPLAVVLPTLLDEVRPAPAALFVVLLGLVCGLMEQSFLSMYMSTVLRSWLVMAAVTVLAIARFLKEPRESEPRESETGLAQAPATSA